MEMKRSDGKSEYGKVIIKYIKEDMERTELQGCLRRLSVQTYHDQYSDLLL